MFDAEQTTFLESGCSLILGTVLPDGEPHAGRGWGLTVLPVAGQVRLLLDAEDSATVARAAAGGAIAITGRRRAHASVDAAQGPGPVGGGGLPRR